MLQAFISHFLAAARRPLAMMFLLMMAGLTLAQKDAGGPLVVGSEEDYPPFAIGKTDATAGGYTVELWKAVAAEFGLQFTIRVRPFRQLLEEFKAGKIDVMINLAQSDERRAFADFSVPHVIVHGAIFVRKGESRIHSEADLPGKSIIVLNADLAHDYAISKHWEKQLVLVDTAAEGMNLLASGQHDAMLLSKLAGMQTLAGLQIRNITALDAKAGFSQKFSFAVQKGNSALLAKVNEGLALAKSSGTYDTLYEKWFGVFEVREVKFRQLLKYFGLTSLALLIFTGVVLARQRERDKTAEVLRERDERLRAALSASGTGTFRWNMHTNELRWDEGLDALFGLPSGRTIRSLDEFIAAVHPDDRPGVAALCERCAREGTDFDMEYRVIWPDASIHWLDAKGKTVSKVEGKPLYMTGACVDITGRKLAQQAQVKSELFAQAALDSLGAHIAVLDERGVIIATNRAWKEFACANDGDLAGLAEGANYAAVCSAARSAYCEEASGVAEGIRAVMAEEVNEYVLEYPCHSPDERRWFQCRITRFPAGGPGRVVVAHENVSLIKEVEEQLQKSERTFLVLARVAPAGIFRSDEQGRCTYVNQYWCTMTGLSEEQSFGTGWLLAIHPEDFQRVINEWTEAIRQGLPFRSEYRCLRRDGKVVWAFSEAVKLTDKDGAVTGYIGTVVNITPQKEAEELLRALSIKAGGLTDDAFFRFVARRLAESLGVEFGFVARIGGEHGEYLTLLAIWGGDQFAPVFGYEIAGTPCEDVVGKELRIYPSGVQQQFPHAPQLRELDIESFAAIPLFDIAGKSLGLLGVMSRHPLREPQRVASFLELFAVRTAAEISRHEAIQALETSASELHEAKLAIEEERSQLVRRVEERTADLVEANAELERASRLKSEFLANMSHELRTPLNAILGLSEALLEQVGGSLTPRQLRSVTTIFTSGQHLLALINDVLDLAKIDAGKLDLHPDRVIVEDVCQASLAFIGAQATKKQITVGFENDGRAAVIEADPKRIRQILVNLLTNAVKFTPEGGEIGLKVSAPEGAGIIRFVVWDTGIGIASEDAGRLFTSFTQVDSGLNRGQEGTGLGLAIVAKLADLHGGGVALESEPGKGSQFTVTLPLHEDRAGTASRAASAPSPKFPRAIVVDDDPGLAALVATYLANLGFRSIILGRGDEVMDAVLRERPDVVLMDVDLPGSSGWDVLKLLKTHPDTHDIPVLIVSGENKPETSLALGAAAHLTKPFTNAEFAEFIKQSFVNKKSPVIPASVNTTSQSGPLILLAEDNAANIETIGGYLETIGHQMCYALTGVEAVRKAREISPALILMDIQMPVMDGLTAIRELRADPAVKDIPIIALTGLAMPGDRERCLAAGADDYLSKPVSLQDLVKSIRSHLKTPGQV